jgi:hypothetical protein
LFPPKTILGVNARLIYLLSKMLLFFSTKSTQQRLAQYIIDFSIFQTFRWLFCLFAENPSLHLSFFRGNRQGIVGNGELRGKAAIENLSGTSCHLPLPGEAFACRKLRTLEPPLEGEVPRRQPRRRGFADPLRQQRTLKAKSAKKPPRSGVCCFAAAGVMLFCASALFRG